MNAYFSTEADPSDDTKEQLIDDFKAVVADAEALLKATVDQGGEAVAAARAKTEASLTAAKAKMADAQSVLRVRSRAAAKATEDYVHTHLWQSMGAAIGVGLVIGLLIGRR